MVALERWADVWGLVMLTIICQAGLLAVLALGCEWALRLRPARVRHWLWWSVLLAPLLLAPARLALEKRAATLTVPAPPPLIRAVWFTQSLLRSAEPPTLWEGAGGSPAAVPVTPPRSFELSASVALLAGWLLGCAVVAGRLLLGHRSLRRLLAASQPVSDGPARALLEALRREAGVRQEVALRSTTQLSAPLLYGLRRPAILMPREWLDSLPPEELRVVLAHEVAHVKRGDVLGNLLQRMAELPLFFHPAAWLAGRRITLAREELCDAVALSEGADPHGYALSLLSVAEKTRGRLGLASVGVAEGKFTLLRRVEAIMKGDVAGRMSRLAGIVLVAVMLVVAAALALVQIGARQAAAQGGGGGREGGGGGGIHEPYQVNAPTNPPPTPEYTVADLDPSLVHSYQVNRVVTDFPDVEDFSTPEAAYATIQRASARGDQGIWRRITGRPEIVSALPPADAPPKPVPPEAVRERLGCRVVEVWIYRDWHCLVIAELPSNPRYQYDIRSLRLVDGQWLNLGSSAAANLELARSHFVQACLSYDKRTEKYYEALAHPELIVRMATTLFEAIQGADYDYFLNSTKIDVWQEFPHPDDVDYTVHTDCPGWVDWVCTTFRRNPIVRVELGEVFEGEYGRPTIPYRLTLRDGAILSGDLPFRYYWVRDSDNWTAMEGLDWHL